MTNFLHSSRSSSRRSRSRSIRKPSLFPTTTRPLPPANHNLPHPSFPNTLLHLTSPHLQPTSWHQNKSHHHQGTSPSWNGWTFVHTRKAVLAPHWSDALYTSSRHAFGTALVCRLVHVVCASFYFGTSHVLLGKTVAMGGCNLKMKKSWRGVGGGGRSASPPDAGSHALFTPMSLHEYASYIDFEVGTNPTVRVCAVVPTHHLRSNHIISHFGTSHVLLGKIVAMGGGNLKIKNAGGGLGGRAQRLPPRCRVTLSIHTGVAAWVCLIYKLRSWNQPNCAYMRRCPDTSPQNQPHYFLLWYQSCPSWQDCGHGRRQPKNDKKLEGVGGRAQRLPPRCRVTRSIHTDVAAWVCLIYRLRSWNEPNCAYMRRCPDTSPQNQPHYFLLWCQSCPSWQDCGHGRRQPKHEKKLEGGWGGGRSASPRCRVARSIHTHVAAWVCLI